MMRVLLAFAALAVLASCWDESAVLEECVRVGRCGMAPIADAGQDAGDGALDGGQQDAGLP